MGLGAIVLVGAEGEAFAQGTANSAALRPAEEAFLAEPLACCQLLGRSVAERTIERLLDAGVETVSVLLNAEAFYRTPLFRASFGKNVSVQLVNNLSAAIAQKLSEYSANGIRHAFLCSAEAYSETDLLDLFYFHLEARQTITPAFDQQGAVPLWVVDCAKALSSRLEDLLKASGQSGASYLICGPAHRLSHPRDLRRLAIDMLNAHYEKGPSGVEVRRGVWMDEGAEVHRGSRIVGPAYIGRGCQIAEDTLITRDSSIETDCRVGYGSVIQNSSVLAHTHIGIWLDVSHAVVAGNKLFSLEHDVTVEIFDRGILRSTVPVFAASSSVSARHQRQKRAAGLQEAHAAPRAWQLGANLIQE